MGDFEASFAVLIAVYLLCAIQLVFLVPGLAKSAQRFHSVLNEILLNIIASALIGEIYTQ